MVCVGRSVSMFGRKKDPRSVVPPSQPRVRPTRNSSIRARPPPRIAVCAMCWHFVASSLSARPKNRSSGSKFARMIVGVFCSSSRVVFVAVGFKIFYTNVINHYLISNQNRTKSHREAMSCCFGDINKNCARFRPFWGQNRAQLA